MLKFMCCLTVISMYNISFHFLKEDKHEFDMSGREGKLFVSKCPERLCGQRVSTRHAASCIYIAANTAGTCLVMRYKW